MRFLGKDWICMKNLKIQFAQARDQITNIYQREILHSRDVQISPREKDQVDFVLSHMHENFDKILIF